MYTFCWIKRKDPTTKTFVQVLGMTIGGEGGIQRLLYRCVLHEYTKTALLIPSYKVFSTYQDNLIYDFTKLEKSDQSERTTPPSLRKAILDFIPLTWTEEEPTMIGNVATNEFDLKSRAGIGEPDVQQLRYRKHQLYYLGNGNEIEYDGLWAFIQNATSQSQEDPGTPPGYGP